MENVRIEYGPDEKELKGYVSGARREPGFRQRHLHSILLIVHFCIVRLKTGGHTNSVMDATSGSTIWKVTDTYVFSKPSATCHGR